MALNQTNKLAWIIETIAKAGKITFDDLNRKWVDNDDFSHGEPLQKRTFHKWRLSIWDTFGLDIQCDNSGLYRYYIANQSDLQSGSIERWLLNTYSVSNSLLSSKSLKDRILLEDSPSGRYYLSDIIEAMKGGKMIWLTYYNYWRGEERRYHLIPLCVKLFRRRWYLVGSIQDSLTPRIYCLDRIRELGISDQTFQYPEQFSPKDYFEGCFGIIVDHDYDIESVRLKVGESQSKYLRDLPLHPSQQEVERHGDHSIFELRVRPTFDFQQELLWNGEELEVISPTWLREEMARMTSAMASKYSNSTKSDSCFGFPEEN